MISPAKHQAILRGVPSIFDFLLFTVAVAKEDLLCTPLYHTPRTNQMGYIKVKAQFAARDLWQRKPPLSSGAAGDWVLTIAYLNQGLLVHIMASSYSILA